MTTMTEAHLFERGRGAAAWICRCGGSRNSAAHRGAAPALPGVPGLPEAAATVATRHLELGCQVFTTEPVGTDFGLPLVEPTRRRRGSVVRTVRNHVKCQGGTVVWFTDGTKSKPVNGHTGWLVAGTDPADQVRPAS